MKYEGAMKDAATASNQDLEAEKDREGARRAERSRNQGAHPKYDDHIENLLRFDVRQHSDGAVSTMMDEQPSSSIHQRRRRCSKRDDTIDSGFFQTKSSEAQLGLGYLG